MPEQSLKEKTAKGLLWGAINNGVQQILVLAFGIILGRLLSPSEYGMVGMLTIFTLIGNSLQESGFRAALVNLKEIRHEDYNAVFWCSTFIGIAAYLIPLLLSRHTDSQLRNRTRSISLPQSESTTASHIRNTRTHHIRMSGSHISLLWVFLLGYRHSKPYLPDSCNSLLLAFFIMASNIAYRFQSAETSFFIQQQNFDN